MRLKNGKSQGPKVSNNNDLIQFDAVFEFASSILLHLILIGLKHEK